ncbi:MAG TPA: helix-turn-helix transcriptional regulator [Thermoanaerobaculia bacterium]|nr:helix-turn-helix transcriptional regulator [Thermoanaerobaculia bacterium]
MSTDLGLFQKMVAEAEATPDFWAEGAILEFTEALWARMEEEKVSRAELARRLGTSKAYVTKVLGGNANFTLHSLAKLALAVGGKVRIGIEPIAPKGRKPRPQKLAPFSAPAEGGARKVGRAKSRQAAAAKLGSKSKI